MINFKFIRWKNLLSTGNDFIEVALNQARTTLIVGTNGAGKSTILDALTFVLFNKPFRKVNKGQLINSVTNKGLVVEVEFEKGGFRWLVRRGSKPNIFDIIKNDVLVDQSSENRDYQEYLETVLGMNQKAFSQVVILGSASFVPFMQLTVPQRREVIEDLLDIQVFTQMNILLKGRVTSNRDAVMAAQNDHTLLKTKIEMAEEYNRKQQAGNDEIIATKTKQIDDLAETAMELLAKIDDEEAGMANLVEQITTMDIPGLEQTKRDTERSIVDCEQSLQTTGKLAEFLKSNDSCPTCKQNIDDEFKKHKTHDHQQNVDFMGGLLQELKDKISKIYVLLDIGFECNKQIKKAESKIAEYNREIGWYHKQAETLTEEIERLQAANSKSLTDTGPMLAELAELKAAVEQARSVQEILAAAALLLKDGGIKSVIIKQYVPIINDLINQYLTNMDFFVDFRINESFEETIKSRFRDEFSYESFSEGEKMRIDLAVLFAWRTVAKMRNSASTNLLIFDEVLDSSLDQYGIDEFLRIIQSLTEQENIFIISHRGDAIGDKFDRVLRFNKVQSFSQLVEV